MSRIAYLAFSVVAYAAFGVSLVWAFVFLTGAGRTPLVDSGRPTPPALALAADLGLLSLFAISHSVLARPAVKGAVSRVLPRAAERSLYVLVAAFVLLLLFWEWRPLPATTWSVGGVGAGVLAFIAWSGWAGVLASSFMIDHLDLFGLRQGWHRFRERPYAGPAFQARWFYRWVRHPMMTCFLVIFWAVPHMTVGHLLFSVAASGYILVGTRLEERDLLRELPEYAGYRVAVGGLVPHLPAPRSARLAR